MFKSYCFEDETGSSFSTYLSPNKPISVTSFSIKFSGDELFITSLGICIFLDSS